MMGLLKAPSLLLIVSLTGATGFSQVNAVNALQAAPSDIRVTCMADEKERNVAVTLRNVASHPVSLRKSRPLADYRIIVEDLNTGRLLPLTEAGKMIDGPLLHLKPDGVLRPFSRSYDMLRIKPAGTQIEKVNLMDAYKIPATGGSFLVQIARMLQEPNKGSTDRFAACPMLIVNSRRPRPTLKDKTIWRVGERS